MATAYQLTDEDRATLNDAMAIIDRCTAQGSSWQICANRYDNHPFGFDVTYFDSNPGAARGQHGWVKGETLADKVQSVLEIEACAADKAETNRIARIASLQKELASLTGEAA